MHGIEEHTVKNLKLGTVAGLVQSHRDLIVCIMHQYALYGKARPFIPLLNLNILEIKWMINLEKLVVNNALQL